MAKKRKLDKVHGITGNSGMIAPGLHIAANYKVDESDTVFIDDDGGWRRVKKSDLQPDSRVIKCFKCDRPAVTISHYYPWEGYESNLCIVHAKTK